MSVQNAQGLYLYLVVRARGRLCFSPQLTARGILALVFLYRYIGYRLHAAGGLVV
jgi:hypothetical protein